MDIIFELASRPVLAAALAAVFGLAIGSFLNVVVHRIPLMMEQEWQRAAADILDQSAGATTAKPEGAASEPERPVSLAWPGSFCPACGSPLKAWENIPVFSYLILHGRCSHCAVRIRWRYPAIEALTGVLFAFCVLHWGVGWAALAGMYAGATLITLSAIDAEHRLLPDEIVYPLLWIGLLVNLDGTFVDLESAVIGACAGYICLWAPARAYELVTGRVGMGNGDFKLFAAIGAWVGWQLLPIVALSAAILGVLVALIGIAMKRTDRDYPIPFGLFLSVAAWPALAWGQDIAAAIP